MLAEFELGIFHLQVYVHKNYSKQFILFILY